jgi:hypothetical protein
MLKEIALKNKNLHEFENFKYKPSLKTHIKINSWLLVPVAGQLDLALCEKI